MLLYWGKDNSIPPAVHRRNTKLPWPELLSVHSTKLIRTNLTRSPSLHGLSNWPCTHDSPAGCGRQDRRSSLPLRENWRFFSLLFTRPFFDRDTVLQPFNSMSTITLAVVFQKFRDLGGSNYLFFNFDQSLFCDNSLEF